MRRDDRRVLDTTAKSEEAEPCQVVPRIRRLGAPLACARLELFVLSLPQTYPPVALASTQPVVHTKIEYLNLVCLLFDVAMLTAAQIADAPSTESRRCGLYFLQCPSTAVPEW